MTQKRRADRVQVFLFANHVSLKAIVKLHVGFASRVSLHSLTASFPVSWELTDDELTSGQRVSETATPKSRPKPRNHASATPTFVANHSDSDEEMRDDDGEYTEEHQLTRIRRGRQVNPFITNQFDS